MAITDYIPPEPMEVKEYLRQQIRHDYFVGRAIVKQATWASFLWHEWKPYLAPKGATWQLFERAVRNTSHVFVDWANGRTSWQTTLGVLSDQVGDAIAWHNRHRLARRV